MPSTPSHINRDDLGAGRFEQVRVFDELDSTNRYLLDEAEIGAPDGIVAVARHQTAGRGRLGRSWEAPPGSALLASVLIRPDDLALDSTPLLTLAAGVGAAEAVVGVAGVEVALKWPNDLRIHDRKLAGILAESVSKNGRVVAVVVGIGVNLERAALSDEVAPIATSLEDSGAEVDADDLLHAFLDAFSHWVQRLEQGESTDLIAAFSGRCETLGRRVRAETPGGEVQGTATSIGQDGALIVDTVSGAVHVSSGEVIHFHD